MSQMEAADNESIDRASSELHARGWRKAFGLNEILAALDDLVTKIEQGYDEIVSRRVHNDFSSGLASACMADADGPSARRSRQ